MKRTSSGHHNQHHPASTRNISVKSDALERITQGIYRKNEELARNNRSLRLLRRIDKIVLSDIASSDDVIRQLAEAVTEDTDFSLALIYLRSHNKVWLEPKAMSYSGANQKVADDLREELLSHTISLKHPRNAVVRATKNLFIVSAEKLYELTQPFVSIEEAHDYQDDLGLESFFICPIYSHEEAVGAMVFGSTTKLKDMSYFEMDMLEQLTVAFGIAINDTLLYTSTVESAHRLRIANRRLKELDKAKDEFISMASHQLRTPLTSIKGYISMLSEGDAGTLSEEQKQYLDYAYLSTNRMVELISDLLNVSRMQAGRFYIDMAPTNLVAMVADEVKTLQTHAEPKNITLKFEMPKSPIPVLNIDETKTRQVIMNFIDNAIYYTRKGGVTVSLKKVGKRVELRVKDTGIGVPRSAKAKLFTKFYRAENAQSMRPDGTGLGLYMAKRVIEDQGGTIIFESEEGKGSTFGFSLPVNE